MWPKQRTHRCGDGEHPLPGKESAAQYSVRIHSRRLHHRMVADQVKKLVEAR
jgi:hypothetical protein